MVMIKHVFTKHTALMAALALGYTLAQAGPAQADKIVVKSDEIQHALGMEKTMHAFTRLSGVLSDLLRAQKLEFGKKHAGQANTEADAAEELLNEAGMAVSQGDLEGSFTFLKKAADIILGAIEKLNLEN